MKAMIFAAGEGQRMRPLTLTTPKPLLQVQGTRLIEHHLIRLKKAGITDIIINIAYLGEQIKQALGTAEHWGLHITYSEEPEPLETGGALYFARAHLGQNPFLLINADIFTDFPFETLLTHPAKALGHLVLVPNPEHHPNGDYYLDTDETLHNVTQSPGFTFSGISLINPYLLDSYPNPSRKFPLREIFNWAIEHQQLTGQVYSGIWSDIGTPERLMEINREFN